MTQIKEYYDWEDVLAICLENSGEFLHPNNWIIYKFVDKNGKEKATYTLALDYMGVRCGGICMLPRYSLVTDDEYTTLDISDDDIALDISDDKKLCRVITKNYTYHFKQSADFTQIKNSIGGYYNYHSIELIEVKKNIIIENESSQDKYNLQLDDNILNFYLNGKYAWSKIISLQYTEGVYFILRDKIFTVISNGYGILDVFNLDGTVFKKIHTSMEYIEWADLDENFLTIKGFMWNPIYMQQKILIDSIFDAEIYSKTQVDFDGDGFSSESETDDSIINAYTNRCKD